MKLTVSDVYKKKTFSFCFASYLLNGTCRVTSIKDKALQQCLGFTPQYVSPVFFVHCHDSPGGIVLPLTWYRWRTGARNACTDFEFEQRSFCLPLNETSFIFSFSFQLIKSSCRLGLLFSMAIIQFFYSFSTKEIFIQFPILSFFFLFSPLLKVHLFFVSKN